MTARTGASDLGLARTATFGASASPTAGKESRGEPEDPEANPGADPARKTATGSSVTPRILAI